MPVAAPVPPPPRSVARSPARPGRRRVEGQPAGEPAGGKGTMTTSTSRMGVFDVARMGYGAMQLAGPHVFGPPRDREEAIAVLRTAVELGVNHIVTADF